ncbi:MAG: hypothetical protein LBT94_07505 [Prevotellaceae bacterium]|nr:hypothetical protein [Prevotellaceae bacterium]
MQRHVPPHKIYECQGRGYALRAKLAQLSPWLRAPRRSGSRADRNDG